MGKKASIEDVEKEIYEKRRTVRYDLREIMIETIVKKYDSSLEEERGKELYNVIYVPEYQRDFTWDEERQSKFIESIILGLPIPFIFVAENGNGNWEIVDGSQRIRSIHSFILGDLKLIKLPSIKSLNGYSYNDLDKSRQAKILNTALKIIVLSEETTDDVKIDMFERINRGSDLLKPMEKRKGIYVGPFNDFIYDFCKKNERYKKLIKINKWLERRQEREELLLRFFALSEKEDKEINIPSGIISSFLDRYMQSQNEKWSKLDEDQLIAVQKEYTEKINRVTEFVEKYFPYGFRHSANPQTKRSVFEAISVGVYLALKEDKVGSPSKDIKDILERTLISEEFKQYTHVTNELHKNKKLNGRINFIRDLLVKKK